MSLFFFWWHPLQSRHIAYLVLQECEKRYFSQLSSLNLRWFQKEVLESIKGLFYVTDRSRSSIFIEKNEQWLLFSIIRVGMCACIHKINSSPSKAIQDFQKSHLCDQATDTLKSNCFSRRSTHNGNRDASLIMKTDFVRFLPQQLQIVWGQSPNCFAILCSSYWAVQKSNLKTVTFCQNLLA